MEGRTALIAAIISGALAIAVVTVDLQFGLEAELQTLEDGEWVTVADSKDPYVYREPGLGCGGAEQRLYVHNGGLRDVSIPVSITYWSVGGSTVTVLDTTWDVGRGDVMFYQVTIPDDAFDRGSNDTMDPPRPAGHTVTINAYVGDTYMSSCATQEASE